MRECPRCGAQNGDSSRLCGTCLQPLGLRASVVNQAAVMCPDPECGVENAPGDEVCRLCRTPLPRSSGDPPAPGTGEAEPSPQARTYVRVNLPPELADRFEIVEELTSTGAEANVLLVRSKKRDEESIVKLYHQRKRPKESVLEQLRSVPEAHAVRIFEQGQTEAYFWERQEYCRYGSLRDRLLAGDRLGHHELRNVLDELVQALVALHTVGVIHRDLKPSNILIRTREPLDLVLGDYGASSIAETSIHITAMAGTPAYMAPEVALGREARVSPAADYWSLGMIMYESLTGELPFQGLHHLQVLHQLAQPIDLGAVTDPSWRLLCQGLLHRQPEHRWQAVEVHAWLRGDGDLHVPPDGFALWGEQREEVNPLPIDGTAYRDPASVSSAMAANWDSAVKLVRQGSLQSWLTNDLRKHDLTQQFCDLVEDETLDLDARTSLTIHLLDPGKPLSFRGFQLDVERGLPALVKAAQAREPSATAAINYLAQDGIWHTLGTLGEQGEDWRAIGSLWRAAVAHFEDITRATPSSHRDTLTGTPWRATLLAAVLVDAVGAELRTLADRAVRSPAASCSWFIRALNGLRPSAACTDGTVLGYALAAALLGPRAEAEGIAAEEAAKRERYASRNALMGQATLGAALGSLASIPALSLMAHGAKATAGGLGVSATVGVLALFGVRYRRGSVDDGCGFLLTALGVGTVVGVVCASLVNSGLGPKLDALAFGWDIMSTANALWPAPVLLALPFAAGGVTAALAFLPRGPVRDTPILEAWQWSALLATAGTLVIAGFTASEMASLAPTRTSPPVKAGVSGPRAAPSVAAADLTATVAQGGVRIRLAPSLEARVWRKLPKGQSVAILGLEEGPDESWVAVRPNDSTASGWVARRLLDASADTWAAADERWGMISADSDTLAEPAADATAGRGVALLPEERRESPPTWRDSYVDARRAYEENRYDEALALCDQALRRSPQNGDVLRLRDEITTFVQVLRGDQGASGRQPH